LVGWGCTVEIGIMNIHGRRMEISCDVEVGIMTIHKRRMSFECNLDPKLIIIHGEIGVMWSLE
jgi:hypothetical protein